MNITREKARRTRAIIEKAAQSLPDEDAVEAPEIFERWKAGQKYTLDQRLQYEGLLWRVRQPELVASELYPPGAAGTEALYEEVPRPGQGDTPENPIRYNNNMELHAGKYYVQDDVVYVCTRDSGQAMTHPLAQLVGLYVEVYAGE